jgi:hypothetical protein
VLVNISSSLSSHYVMFWRTVELHSNIYNLLSPLILVIMLSVYKILTEDTTGTLDVHHAIAFLTKFVIMNCTSFSCGWLTEWIRALLKKQTVTQSNSQHFVEPRGLLLWSQEPIIGPYPEPDEFISRHGAMFP